jgi:1-deoxy-D-xylulose-5-phosphate reductoisomerase
MLRRSVAVLGSTGSVGVSTLDLLGRAVAEGAAEVEIRALTAGRNVALLAEQALAWRPTMAVIADPALYPELKARLAGSGVEAATGEAALVEAATCGAEWVMAAIVGAAGLAPTLAAARAGAIVALANKESLVCAGPALLEAARSAGGMVIPVDSEHSAIFQVLQPTCADRVARLILPEQAVAHPNWSMGAKISIDCATMMNKGLEMIEASYLFAMPESKVEVLVHPQSVIHSLVEYQDGSTLAQLGAPDMRTPIACAFAWPDRLPWAAPRLDLAAIGALNFEALDPERFPALDLARQALKTGQGAPAALNAANETAVAAFLDRRIGFLDIAAAVAETLERMAARGELRADGDDPVGEALGIDRNARRIAAQVVAHLDTP